jgi:tRNA(adenine34) deaminase|tara:strand:- start:633 stop:1082 length:450 start_codon:yes stop_codon:yes gene_type:complete
MEINIKSDQYFMGRALVEAQKAFDVGEVPVGAVITCENQIIARGYNYVQHLNDVTAHAEMQAFTSAADYLGGKYLNECTLYVTLEPCIMCAGASFWTQISRIVVGARDLKNGFSLQERKILHPKTEIEFGLLEEESKKLLHDFFKSKRK